MGKTREICESGEPPPGESSIAKEATLEAGSCNVQNSECSTLTVGFLQEAASQLVQSAGQADAENSKKGKQSEQANDALHAQHISKNENRQTMPLFIVSQHVHLWWSRDCDAVELVSNIARLVPAWQCRALHGP